MKKKKYNFSKLDEVSKLLQTDEKHWEEAREEALQLRFALQPKNPKQERYINAMETSVVTIAIGCAGTGRTYVSSGYAAKLLQENKVDKIILTRPVVECGGEKIGFLPGNSFEKLVPYMYPLIDALSDFLGEKKVDYLISKNIIQIVPIGQMRGSSFKNSVILLDEAENCNYIQLKMFLTRIGENCRAVINGDHTQSDLPGKKCDLLKIIERLKDLPEIAIVRFDKDDVVRSGIVKRMLEVL